MIPCDSIAGMSRPLEWTVASLTPYTPRGLWRQAIQLLGRLFVQNLAIFGFPALRSSRKMSSETKEGCPSSRSFPSVRVSARNMRVPADRALGEPKKSHLCRPLDRDSSVPQHIAETETPHQISSTPRWDYLNDKTAGNGYTTELKSGNGASNAEKRFNSPKIVRSVIQIGRDGG